MPQNQEDTLLRLIDEKELLDLAIAMGNITAPSGYEQPMADFVLQWLRDNGFEKSYQQQLAEGRAIRSVFFRVEAEERT